MKTTKLLPVLLFAITGLFNRLSAETNAPAGPPMSQPDWDMAKLQAAIQTRVPRLEKLGEVPKDADQLDWEAAKQTSWWGKPLDPEKFWRHRVVWLDASASDVAARHGRAFPPMPYDDPAIPHYKADEDIKNIAGAAGGPRRAVYATARERAFWDRFSKTHPRPPEALEREQSTVADQTLAERYHLEHGNPARSSLQLLKESEEIQRQQDAVFRYPSEMFTEDALFWSYVQSKRREYIDTVNAFHTTNGPAIDNFMTSRMWVDPKYMTEPSDAEVLKSANAWKIAYLQRLSKEKVDQSYINAYLKAWNLKPGEVFTNVAVSPQPIR